MTEHDDHPTVGEMINRWYEMGVDSASRSLPLTEAPYPPGTIAYQWWCRGFQWWSANMRYHEIKTELDALLSKWRRDA